MGGTFIFVKANAETIEIAQDIDGSYGLYLFRRDSYFALSNSFLKLAEYVAERYPINFNEDYAAALITSSLNSKAYAQTLIREISMLPRNTMVEIDRAEKGLFVRTMDVADNTVPLDSDDGFRIMDNWYERWTALLRNLKRRSDNITIDLSGGFDSRVAFLIALGADIDLNRVRVNSAHDTLHTHGEDYEIASAIGKRFGFELNHPLKIPSFAFREPETILLGSWVIKAGFHKQMYWKCSYHKEPAYVFGGMGGEIVNGHGMLGVEDGRSFVQKECMRARNYSYGFAHPVRHIMEDMIPGVAEEYHVDEECSYMTLLLYRDTISRNHFGKSKVENLFSNTFALEPLMDPDLRRLATSTTECADPQLLMATLLTSFCPELLDFPFQGGRSIASETLDAARRLNARKPYIRTKREIISKPDQTGRTHGFMTKMPPEERNTWHKGAEVDEIIAKVYESQTFMGLFTALFPQEAYTKVLADARSRAYFPLQEEYAAVAAVQLADLASYSHMRERRRSTKDFLDRVLSTSSIQGKTLPASFLHEVERYATARVDIKNFGSSQNALEVLEADAPVETPAWFTNEKGRGIVLQSMSGTMHIRLKAVGSGALTICLRGVDARDRDGKRFPVWIDYTKLVLDGETLLNGSSMICHDKPFVARKKVQDGTIVEINVEWRPFTQSLSWAGAAIVNSKSLIEKNEAVISGETHTTKAAAVNNGEVHTERAMENPSSSEPEQKGEQQPKRRFFRFLR